MINFEQKDTRASVRVTGELLWFNEAEDVGVIVRDDGERVHVDGHAFSGGVRPEGRCRGTKVAFAIVVGAGGPVATAVSPIAALDARRARPRRRSY